MASTGNAPVRIAHGFGNSRRRLSRALIGPVDLVETDVHFQDGKMVVRHERKVGPLPILIDERKSLHLKTEHTCRLHLLRWYVAFQRSPLALEEILARARGGRGLLLDLKGQYGDREERFAGALADMLEQMDLAEQTTICGQNWSLLTHLRRVAPSLKVHYSIDSARQLEAFQAMLQSDRIGRICLNQSLVEPPLIERLKRSGMTIYTWTVDDLWRAHELLELGVDGIISNSLEMLGLLGAGPRPQGQT
jgi:glycerophosphoryl diester phosphodiesterase